MRTYLQSTFKVIGIIYLSILRIPCFLFMLVWFSILATLVIFGGVGYYALKECDEWKKQDPQSHTKGEIRALYVFAFAAWVIGVAIFLVVCALRKRIHLAIGLVKESSRAVIAMPLLIVFPTLQCVALALFTLCWIFFAASVASIGTVITDSVELHNVTISYRTIQYDREEKITGWYFIFCYFWTAQFITALGEIIVATAVAKWYFTRDRYRVGSWTVIHALRQATFYHFGTAAFGSLVIAVLCTIRALLNYVVKRSKLSGNQIARFILTCMQCLVCCVEKALKFMNKQGESKSKEH